ncbi:CD177 antigen isoform X1 [Mus musculus]|nr:CD177 antigen isoform X1 [Mus musculus]|eukprot:XP_011248990.1 PREDICTED: CD177 antigen isoform X1 [Mus musculus]
MNSIPVLTLLGVTALLPCVPALTCQKSSAQAVRNVAELPLRWWGAGEKTCEVSEGCQDLIMLLYNGPKVNLVIIKGCTEVEDQEPKVIWLRTGPGLSVVSYTRVCRHGDLCNDVNSTKILEELPTPTGASVPGSLRCPLCLSNDSCENAPEQVCPVGSTHCYDGVLRLRGDGIRTNLKVQGCMAQPDCNLLNGTQAIGTLYMSENCDLIGPQALDCNSGSLETVRNVSDLHLSWTTGWQTCEAGEGCYETVMLIQNGHEFHMVLTKGCTRDMNKKARLTRHRTGPGISIVSYVHVCRDRDFCNDLSTTDPLWTPPPDTELGTLRCRHCLSTGSCVSASELVCPAGSTHCYSGVLSLRGGGVISDLKVQGCISQSQPGCNLLNGTQTIGPVDVREDCGLQLDALKCQHGTLKTIQDISKLPLQWTAGQKICNVGEGCQDTLMLIENGEQVNLVLTKGCTTAKDQEAKVTEHRTGPGLSVTSYTRVCRKKDFCNDLSTTAPLWAPPPVTAPGTTRCPLCFSEQACENAPEQVCPAGSTHCYSGVLSLRGGGIISDLKVQGCMSQPGCNLLNGTQTIGPVDVSERCSPPSETTELSCYRGVMFELGNGFAEEPVKWTAPGSQVCAPDEICQETLLLIDVGQKSAFLGSKGCSSPGAQDNIGVSIFSRLPGMLVASYTKFCSSHLCNGADSSSVLLSILPRPDVPPPGDVQCPMCVELFGSCKSTDSVTCPRGATHCYKGDIALQGGGLTTRVSIQGCMAPPIKPLLGDSKTIGIFSAEESSNYRHEDDVTSAPSLAWTLRLSAWMLGLSALLSSLYAGICPLC